MKLLKCKLCSGEVEIIAGERSINKKIKCTNCGFTNETVTHSPEIVVIRKRPKNITE